MISNPGNPTGVVYTREELIMLGDIVKEHDLYLTADGVYRQFVYGSLQYTSTLLMKDIANRVIVIGSISKRYSACGARIDLYGFTRYDNSQIQRNSQIENSTPMTIHESRVLNYINA